MQRNSDESDDSAFAWVMLAIVEGLAFTAMIAGIVIGIPLVACAAGIGCR